MSDIFLGDREANYRERSNNPSMAGIGICATFRCAVCKKTKEAFGRKLLIKGYSKGGYRCSSCVELFAAKSADKTTPPSAGGNPRVASNTVEQI